MAKNNIEPRTVLLNYVHQLLQLYNKSVTIIPDNFKEQVLCVRKILKSDTSGLVNSLLDFAIAIASVPIKIDTTNENFSKVLNSWLLNINSSLRGKIPVGIRPLAKQYFMERWKGSSLIALRTKWDRVDGFELPVKCWVVSDAENIEIIGKSKRGILGEEDYILRVGKNEIPLTNTKKEDEMTFIQRPYDSWGPHLPTPFLIQRGLYKNLSIMDLFVNKGESIVASALEYLLLIKKGSEDLVKLNNEDFLYDEKELRKVEENFQSLVSRKRTQGGIPTHIANFDTEFQELVPEYEKVVKSAIYSPVEKRLLAGMGIIEVQMGSSNSRTEGLLNPKPFIHDINTAADDFKDLMDDLVTEIVIRNSKKHKKYTNNVVTIHRNPIKELMDKDFKTLLRSLFDRGCLSRRTLVDVVGEGDFDLEVQRIESEEELNLREIMRPNPTQPEMDVNNNPDVKDKNENQDKDNVEKLNYINAKDMIVTSAELEMAPYKNNAELPKSVKALPYSAQTIWRKAFNSSYEENNEEQTAIKIAWSAVKKVYSKDKDGKWKKIK